MAVSLSPSLSPVFVAYVTVFAIAGLACFASVRRAQRIEDPDTRRGLTALLLTTGGWGSAHVGFLLAPTVDLSLAFYMAGLVVGLSAVGPWLYFCSAYTGRSLHRNRTYQWAAVAVFVVLVAVKVTNPYHQLYFQWSVVSEPFVHLAIRHQLAHWIVMGLAYGLSMVGYFMLLERFTQISYDTRPLVALIGVTGLPLALDVLGFSTPYLIDMTYEPLGVAVFAVGILWVYVGRFQAVQLTEDRDEPTIMLDDAGQIREYNASAAAMFPELTDSDSLGRSLRAAAPSLAEAVEADASVVELQRNGDTRYIRVSENAFAADQDQLGRLLVLSDVTDREQYRRELERQNERLEAFANMISHDLRNPLSVAMARVEMLTEEMNDNDHAETAADALDRMETLIDDVLTLARQGQPIDETERVSLAALAESSWGMIGAEDATLTIEGDCTLDADATRLKQLLENLFRNAVEHGSTSARSHVHEEAIEHGNPDAATGTASITISVGPLSEGDGFYVADDGAGIPADEREQIFESGYTTADHGTGFGLSIATEIVEAHGWSIDITESADGGARFEITGVEVAERSPPQ